MKETNRLREKISETREKLSIMEMMDEICNTDIKVLAQKAYYERLVEEINLAVSDAIDKISDDPAIRIRVANEILESVGLERIDERHLTSNESILDEYISRFENGDSSFDS